MRLATRLILTGLAIALHAWLPAAHAQAVYNDRTLSQLIDSPPTPAPGSNGQRFTVPVNASATMAFSEHNTLAWFNTPPSDIDWQGASPYEQTFQYLAFQSADTTVRNAFISATDGNGSLTNAFSARIAVEQFRLDNVNLNPRNNVIALTGAQHVWTMNNSSYNGASAKPQFTAPFPLTFTATGTSTLDGWAGNIPSRTDLFVSSGSTLRMSQCGDDKSQDPIDSLRWDSTDGNTADINGSTLSIEHSFVTFATGETPAVTGDVVTAGMVVRNSGVLNIGGSDGTQHQPRLRVEGGLLIDGSTLQVAQRGHLTVTTGKLVLKNATVSFLDSLPLAAVTADVAEFQGTTTINANNPDAYTAAGFAAGFGLADSSAVVNIAGTGPTFADGLFVLNGGTVNVAAGASLDLRSTTGLSAAEPVGNVNVASTGQLAIGPNFHLYTDKMSLHNDGVVAVIGDLLGGGTLSGSGEVVVDGSNALLGVASNRSSFTIDGDLSFLSGSTLGLIVDPSAGTSQHVSVSDLSISTPFNIPTTNLLLTLKNDTVLADGTKFLLVDYDTLTPGEYFDGFADGSIFTQGLNSYQIRYSDLAYSAQNPSVVTLTVVPEPSTWLLAALGSVAGIAHTQLRRRRRKAASAASPTMR